MMSPGFAHTFINEGISIREADGVDRILVGVKTERDPSLEEVRFQDYLESRRAFPPKTGPCPLSASDSGTSRTAVTATDGESTTSTCSLCAARIATSGQQELGGDDDTRRAGDDETEKEGETADRTGARTPSVSVSGHRRFDAERSGGSRSRSSKSKMDRRLRRLEKMVESLSQGLILALTQTQSGDVQAEPRPSSSGPGGRRSHFNAINDEIESTSDDDDVDYRSVSTAFAGMGLIDNAHVKVGTLTPSLQRNNAVSSSSPELETDLSRALRGSSVSARTYVSWLPDDAFSCVATGTDGSFFATSKVMSPVSKALGPILKFVASSDVCQFLKRAEIHAGLSNTQIFDLFWVLDNLFNVHGGILMFCLRKSLNTMDGISRSLGSDEWSRDQEVFRKLDEAYCKDLRPHIRTDGRYSAEASNAWKSYCLELAQIFSERFSNSRSAGYFLDLSESYTGCFNPVITTSYVDDLVTIWTPVHPALLEVTRWLEPFIDYGPDCDRATPLYDATSALGRRARELLSRRGIKELEAFWRADCLLQFLREHRPDELWTMELEVECVMADVSRDFDAAAVSGDGEGDEHEHSPSGSDSDSVRSGLSSSAAEEEAALVGRAKRATGCWQETTTTTKAESPPDKDGAAGSGSSARLRDALALHEVRVMKGYRQRLFREGVAATIIRREVARLLSLCDGDMKDTFWDGISLS